MFVYPAWRQNGSASNNLFGMFGEFDDIGASSGYASTAGAGFVALTPGVKYDFGCFGRFAGPTNMGCNVAVSCH
jgi:hypothetical protein